MKKWNRMLTGVTAVAISAAMLLGGCTDPNPTPAGEGDTTTTTAETTTTQSEITTTTQPKRDIVVGGMEFSLNGENFKLGVDATSLLDFLGKPAIDPLVAPYDLGKDGDMQTTYYYHHICLITYRPVGSEIEYVWDVFLTDDYYKLDKDIFCGGDVDSLLKVYPDYTTKQKVPCGTVDAGSLLLLQKPYITTPDNGECWRYVYQPSEDSLWVFTFNEEATASWRIHLSYCGTVD